MRMNGQQPSILWKAQPTPVIVEALEPSELGGSVSDSILERGSMEVKSDEKLPRCGFDR